MRTYLIWIKERWNSARKRSRLTQPIFRYTTHFDNEKLLLKIKDDFFGLFIISWKP